MRIHTHRIMLGFVAWPWCGTAGGSAPRFADAADDQNENQNQEHTTEHQPDGDALVRIPKANRGFGSPATVTLKVALVCSVPTDATWFALFQTFHVGEPVSAKYPSCHPSCHESLNILFSISNWFNQAALLKLPHQWDMPI